MQTLEYYFPVCIQLTAHWNVPTWERQDACWKVPSPVVPTPSQNPTVRCLSPQHHQKTISFRHLVRPRQTRPPPPPPSPHPTPHTHGHLGQASEPDRALPETSWRRQAGQAAPGGKADATDPMERELASLKRFQAGCSICEKFERGCCLY